MASRVSPEAGAIRVPRILGQGSSGDAAWLELEWFDLRVADAGSDARMGAALARLHAVAGSRYGLDRDNAIGAAPQPNAPADDWVDFWRDRRLGFQLDRAAEGGHGGRLQDRGRRLIERLPAFFAGYRPLPSLLHGDLWAGNRAMLADGTPVIFDPAVYYGDREADVAMTRLFGGFGARFYEAYSAEWPLDAGAGTRDGPLQPLPRPQPPQPVRRRLPRDGRVHDRPVARGHRPLKGRVPVGYLNAAATSRR